MRAAFYCRIGGQGYGFLLPEEADKLREFFAEYQDKPALEKPSSASKIFCRELDIRVPEIVEADMPQTFQFQQLAEIAAEIPGIKNVPHYIHEHIAVVFPVVAVAADPLATHPPECLALS